VRGVPEEVDAKGNLLLPLDTDQFRSAVDELLDSGARLLVVAFRNAAINPENELRAQELFELSFPRYYLGTPFLLASHQVSSRGSDAEHVHSSVLSGYLHRQFLSYLYRCDEALRSQGFQRPLLVVHSTGGLARVAKTKALHTYNSGPTAGVFGAARIARRYGFERVITMDMGGTSTDVAFISGGKAGLSFHAEIEGVPLNLPMIDVLGLGGGGGSIASVQDGVLRVGPESAGAVPGPACYDLGNAAPTVTDADVVLGFIAPDNFLGGRRRLNSARAIAAVEQNVGRPLHLGIDQAAQRICSTLANALAQEIRIEAQKRSFPLADACLFAYGGAGPVHAAAIAEALGIGTFYVFPESPVFSAAGCSSMKVEHYYERRVRPRPDECFADALRRAMGELELQARRDVRGEGFAPESAQLRFVVEAGSQEREVALHAPLDEGLSDLPDGLLRLVASLPQTMSSDSEAVPATNHHPEQGCSPREVGWASGRRMTPIFSLGASSLENRISGPAVIESGETSCVVPEGWAAEKDRYGALRVHR
jgi:N-methylhydantoinase A